MDSFFPNAAEQADNRRKIYRVSELARRIKAVLEDDIGTVWVEGEVSGFKNVASGHIYFDLKDEAALINCCLFRNTQRGLRTVPANGLLVRVAGEITSYPPRSNYQLIVQKVEAAGQGSLQEAFEKLKAKLAAEGLFADERKRTLPLLPRVIGVVTSPTGAVIRDILHVLGRRYPDRHVLLAPVRVQGAGAAEEIAAALDLMNARGDVDVLIVGRGGGSLEDLWAFNEEIVARAVARSAIPVISAVGHETDFTICDFVADKRAATPSVAAELVIRPKADWEEHLATSRHRLAQALRHRALEFHNRFTRAARSYAFREPANLLARHRERLSHLRGLQGRLLQAALAQAHQRTDEAVLRIGHAAGARAQQSRRQLERAEAALRAMSPLAVLERGYSITHNARGEVVRDAAAVAAGETIRTRLARGLVHSTVKEVERNT